MTRKNIEGIYPLSASQQGMLFETLASEGAAGIHVEQLSCRIEGVFDSAAFAAAWQQVVERHGVFRTAFVWQDQPEPLQVVVRQLAVSVRQDDWSGLPETEQGQRIDAFLTTERRQGFTLTRPPLLRLALFRLAERSHQFCLTFHHLLMDGWCIPLVFADVLAFYRAHTGAGDPRRVPCRQFRDYMAWLKSQDWDRAETFWRRYLQGFTAPTSLGVETPGTTDSSGDGERHGHLTAGLSAETTGRLQALAKAHRLTLSILLQGLWAILLSRYDGSREVVFGATVSGRPAELDGVETIVGPFINSLPVRVELPSDSTVGWIDWLQTLQAQQVEAQVFQYCAAGQIQQWSELSGGRPLYESLLVVENYPVADLANAADPPFDIRAPRAIGAQTQLALTLLIGVGTAASLHLVYDRRRFRDADTQQILEHLQGLAAQVAIDPNQPPADLAASIPAEQRPCVAAPVVKSASVYVAPRTALELRLSKLWESLFDRRPIGVRDNFFELGGHSLLALRLIAGIERQFGQKLPLGTLFQGPTIERLATVLQKRGDLSHWSPLVAIQPRGSRPPLFCIHPLGGHVICYGDLARHLGPEQPVYGLQARGMEPDQTPLTDYPTLAQTYRAAIQAVQPRGPYYLAGYSFGGMAAVEMARQWLAEGESVAFLGLLDTPNPAIVPETMKKTDSAGLLASLFAESFELSLERLREMTEDEQLAFVLERAKQAHLVTPEAGLEEARRHFAVCKANQAMEFSPRPFPGSLLLLRGRDGAARITDDPTLGWHGVAAGGVEVRWVSGRHENMLNPAHVADVAAVLGDALSQAQNRMESSDNLASERL
ncbi:MAG: hypothetical protein H6970_09690 [Gammaproteobacteria bacterium]|nr:hypothetical protein [Gammaproteobacteria bacterium]